MSAAQYLYKRFQLNGRLLEVRKIVDVAHPEIVVRYVNDNAELSAGEFNLTLEFLLKYGKQVHGVGAKPKAKQIRATASDAACILEAA